MRRRQVLASRSPSAGKPASVRVPALTVDDAFIALFIAAMNANDHVSAAEGARAHHLIWSMKRFRRKSGETVGRGIERMKRLVESHGSAGVITAAARAIPRPLRLSAYALTVDLLLADGTIERAERRFLDRLRADLRLTEGDGSALIDAMLIKNRA